MYFALLRRGFDGSQNVSGHFLQLDIVMLGYKLDTVISYGLDYDILHRDRSASERQKIWHGFLGCF